jgi:PHD/YefM family antitoxin component YafN of YafNO toxin-antitoxin module
MGPLGCSETSVTTDLRCVTSQKSEDLIYVAAEAWNHDQDHDRTYAARSNDVV